MHNTMKIAKHVVVKDLQDFIDGLLVDSWLVDGSLIPSLTEDVTEDLISSESDENGFNEDEGTTAGWEGDASGRSSASSSTTTGMEFCHWRRQRALFGITLAIRWIYTER